MNDTPDLFDSLPPEGPGAGEPPPPPPPPLLMGRHDGLPPRPYAGK